ncbi:MAG: hypothetical protein KAT66_04420 [Candidatus Lokiarchaeota archaeon]|nr:hypothetical protein [Candidatus Lokiarchaeota archaeon]
MNEDNNKKKIVTCCVMNCQAEVPIEKAIIIEGKCFCPSCGTAYYRSILNL